MATAQTIIDQAIYLGGVVEVGVSASTAESADALVALNQMLDGWGNEFLMCYAIQDETVPLASGNSTRTIGPTGQVVSTRPTNILDAYIIYSATSIPVRILNDYEWAALPDKTSTSTYPDRLMYRPEMPDGKIYLYPIPNASSSLHILTETPLTAFATLATTVSLPPGWEEALTYNLYLRLAPRYGRPVDPTVREVARESKANIKRANYRPTKATTEIAALTSGKSGGSILTDGQ